MPSEPSPRLSAPDDASPRLERGEADDRVAEFDRNGGGPRHGRRGPRFAPPEPEPTALEVSRPRRRDGRSSGRMRARKVTRIIRRVDPWSVLKVSLLFYLCLFLVTMVAATVLWNVAGATGALDDVQNFIRTLFALETFTFNGPLIFRATMLIGVVLVVIGSAVNVLMVVLFNLISDIVGGIRITVIEEETARPVE
ncbi:MAG: DUF3566 domain-containing protein [Acidimicrobiia bacterium]